MAAEGATRPETRRQQGPWRLIGSGERRFALTEGERPAGPRQSLRFEGQRGGGGRRGASAAAAPFLRFD